MHLKRLLILAVVWAALPAAQALAVPQPAYISGAGEPYGLNGNIEAMNAAFGAGNWQRLTFANAVGSGAFTPGAFSMLYFDGSDGYDGDFTSFITANKSALETYVSGGGHVFLNAARQSGSDLDLGFSVTLHYQQAPNGYAANLGHQIFNGPLTPTGSSWSGFYFAQDEISGTGLGTLITNNFSNPVLAELSYGNGVVLFGGMTLSSYHSPQPEALNLRANILSYTNTYIVPEPATLQMGLMLGFGGFGILRIRKRPSA